MNAVKPTTPLISIVLAYLTIDPTIFWGGAGPLVRDKIQSVLIASI